MSWRSHSLPSPRPESPSSLASVSSGVVQGAVVGLLTGEGARRIGADIVGPSPIGFHPFSHAYAAEISEQERSQDGYEDQTPAPVRPPIRQVSPSHLLDSQPRTISVIERTICLDRFRNDWQWACLTDAIRRSRDEADGTRRARSLRRGGAVKVTDVLLAACSRR